MKANGSPLLPLKCKEQLLILPADGGGIDLLLVQFTVTVVAEESPAFGGDGDQLINLVEVVVNSTGGGWKGELVYPNVARLGQGTQRAEMVQVVPPARPGVPAQRSH
ncbi:MAG: hypothetical protein KDI62_27395 [Anaerolineae bacterium]|nr:hypothetical protein [Anaerolineae bacterium]MCB9105180.1 hypothetical protein [Anaerolineales bacterium]